MYFQLFPELERIFTYSRNKNTENLDRSNKGLAGHGLEFGVYFWYNGQTLEDFFKHRLERIYFT